MTARAALASTPQERFRQRIDIIRARIDRLPDDAVRAALEELEALRRRVLGELAGAEGFSAQRLGALAGRIQDVTGEFASRYGTAIQPFQAEAVGLGRALIAQPVVEGGLTLGVPEIPRRLVEAAQDFHADLITGLSRDAGHRITQALRLGALEGKSVFEVMQEVAGSLRRPGPFASIAARAEAITRTELGRLQAIAGQATLEESRRLVPDLQKEWRHSGAIDFRPTHKLADGQVRDVHDFFDIAPAANRPAEQLLYPRDPRASAANSVNCGCLSLPYKADWPA
jgi:hypothetical protein